MQGTFDVGNGVRIPADYTFKAIEATRSRRVDLAPVEDEVSRLRVDALMVVTIGGAIIDTMRYTVALSPDIDLFAIGRIALLAEVKAKLIEHPDFATNVPE